jgi:outer membrane protein TolC
VMDAQLALTRARQYHLAALHDLNVAAARFTWATGATVGATSGNSPK